MKNRKSIGIMLLIVCLLFSVGCGKKSADPSGAAGTQALETHVRSKKELKASFSSVVADSSNALAGYQEHEVAFSNEAKLYGMDSETAALVTYKEGTFRAYVMSLKLTNTKEYDLTVQTVLSPDNGKNGVWVCGVSQYGAFDVSARSTVQMPIMILVDGSVTADNAVEAALRGMNLSLEYTDATDNGAEQTAEVGTVAVTL